MAQQNLYLIEILIKRIVFGQTELDKWQLAVDVILGPIAEFTIQHEEKNESFDMSLANPGKSFLFPSSNYVLKSQLENSEIKFTVRCLDKKLHYYGRAVMAWPYSFLKLVRQSDDQRAIQYLQPAVVTEDLAWVEGPDREPSAPPPEGYIRVFMRLTSFGHQLATPYQVLQTKDDALSYLFKGTKVPASFRSSEYGRENDEDLLALGPIFSNKDRKKEGSNYSIDITVSEIEATLCKDEECLACHKFKEFGIGPLAKPKKVIISPCNDPVCEYAYEQGAPPCIGHRKCHWNLPNPPVNQHIKRRILSDGTCATETCCPWERDDTNYNADAPTRETSTQIDAICVNPSGGVRGSVADDPKMCPVFVSPMAEASTSKAEKCPLTECPFKNKSRKHEASTSVHSESDSSISNICKKHLRGGGNDNQQPSGRQSPDVKTLHTCPKKNGAETKDSSPAKPPPNKTCNCQNCIHKGKPCVKTNNGNKKPKAHCTDCGGYSFSGKTCHDLQREAGGGLSLPHSIQDYITIKNVKCFCDDKCKQCTDNFSQTEFCDVKCKNTFEDIQQHYNKMIRIEECQEEKDDCVCNQQPKSHLRLKSGATSTTSKEQPNTGVSPVSGRPLTQANGGGPGGDIQQMRRRYCSLVYNIGDTYPGNNRGHKTCFPKIVTCPIKKGWAWYPEPLIYPLKPRKEYRPGFIQKDVQQIINDCRETSGLPLQQTKAPKKKKKKKAGVSTIARAEDEDEDDEEEYEVEERQTLTFTKTKGHFEVSCNPLRDPKKVADNEDPYINCPPITIKYTPDPLKYADREDACDCCTCKDEDESDEDDDINLDFSPPMGVIEMERMKKAPNVVHFWTQYDTADFGFPQTGAKGSKK